MNRAYVAIALLSLMAAAGWTSAETPEEALNKSFGAGSPLVIPAAAFSTNGNDADSTLYQAFFGFIEGTGVGGGCVQAPAYLPHGARITSMYVSLVDNDSSNNIYVSLYRRANDSLFDVTSMAYVQSSGASTSVIAPYDASITSPTVDFPRYSYYVTTCLPTASTRLISIRLYYQETLFVDGFECGETWVWSSATS